ncbi:MAG TPA: transglutaminaseTgpA domain-containing protein [Anaerolineales bacterium]|nr:transglutaminaseTgpA domain-containing protein [Anaerolineales bacterium]
MEKTPEQSRWWDWPAILLLCVLLQTVAARLIATDWVPDLPLIQLFTTMGTAIGLALGYSQFPRRTARWISFFYMIILLPLQWTLVIDQEAALEEQLLSVGGRLLFSISEFFSRRPVEDPLFFIAAMSIAYWAISASAAFTLLRQQNFLRVVAPSAIGMLIIQNYDNVAAGRLWFLAFFVFVSLFLLGRINFLQDQKQWREKRVFLSPENSVDLTSGMAIAAGLIILIAWTVPISFTRIDSARQTWNRLVKPWTDFAERMENAVSALESPSGGRPGEFYGTELELGQGFPLSDTVMFQVQVPDLSSDERPPRYYWRGRVYDYFTRDQWYTTGTSRQEYSPLNPGPAIPETTEGNLSRFVIGTGEERFSLLYAPQQLAWVSRGGSYLAAPAGENTQTRDVFSWNASPTLMPGETYQVDSMLKNPNITELREAGTDYPEWVTERYLQLPEDFSPRIIELAQQITAEAETPYDKAGAITRYLRDNIEYSETIPAPPRNADLLEWILFEHKQGYCVYYATSQILMLRSLGIPARMAVGFAQGEGISVGDNLAPEEGLAPGIFTVRKKNAHAWPEVYFPGIGWVEFEPTGNQDPLNRPVAPQDPSDANNFNPVGNLPLGEGPDLPSPDRGELGDDLSNGANQSISPLLYLIPLIFAFAALAYYLGRRYSIPTRVPVFLRSSIERSGAAAPAWVVNWERWVSLSPIEKAFESINFGLRSLHEPAAVHATPVERADKLSMILPHLKNPIKVLLDEHQTSLYTSRVGDAAEAQRAAFQLRMQVILSRIRHFWTGSYITKT